MKKITIKFNRKFVFNCKDDAEKALSYAKEIAQLYGYTTVADICDLIGVTPTYVENLYGWTPDAIGRAEICENYSNYILHIPKCDWSKGPEQTKNKDSKKTKVTKKENNMNKSTKGLYLVYSCKDDTEIGGIMDAIDNLFKNSDHMTKYELLKILGLNATNEDKNVGWTIDACGHAELNFDGDVYELYFPPLDWHREESASADEPEPINISVSREEIHENPDIIEQVITTVFKNLSMAADRPVFINII